jgi:hypothetical protein
MSDQNILDLVEGNAKVINEIYESVMILRRAVAIVQTLLEEQERPGWQATIGMRAMSIPPPDAGEDLEKVDQVDYPNHYKEEP